MSQIGDPVSGAVRAKLNGLLFESGQTELDPETADRFEAYLHLLLRWNSRTNLTAVRDEDGILRRHFLESIACARALPAGISTLLDFGSGAGFPGLPIALCRPEIAVTLAESQGKKAAFLREAVRTLGITVEVHAARAESLAKVFDCVTLRAVDRMGEAIRAASALVGAGGWLAPLTTRGEAGSIEAIAGPAFLWEPAIPLAGGEARVLLLGRRAS
jgi:16S rRNA (guanine527-N7)-methyltransferase